MTIFWLVIAIFYATLAIVTFITSKPLMKALKVMNKHEDSIIWEEEIGLESLLNKAFRAIFITDMIGFALAAIAAIISAFSVSR